MVTLLCSSPVIAMDNDAPQQKILNSIVIREQNQDYSESLYTDSVQKDSELNQLKLELEDSKGKLEATKIHLSQFQENKDISEQLEKEQNSYNCHKNNFDLRYFILFEKYKSMCQKSGVEPVKSKFPPLLTIDISSDAGLAYRKGDRESDLIKAVALNHAYAPRILFSLHGDKNPEYRNLLLQTVLKKIETGFNHGLDKDLNALRHPHPLYKNNFCLEELLSYISNMDLKEKKAKLYYYIIKSDWKELGPHIKDIYQSEEMIDKARFFLGELLISGDHMAHLYLGKIALNENMIQEAYDHLFNIDLISSVVTNATYGRAINPEWLEAVECYINLSDNNPNHLNIHQILGKIYKKMASYEEAFEAYFTAYKIALSLGHDSLKLFPIFNACNECTLVQPKDITYNNPAYSRKDKINFGKFRYLGYVFHSYLAEQESEPHKIEQEMGVAQGCLKASVLEGYSDVLETILSEDTAIFELPIHTAKFLEDLIIMEWAKEKKSTEYVGGHHAYYMFENHTTFIKDRLKAKLLSLFYHAPENDIEIKITAAKSLVRFYDSEFTQISGKYRVDSKYNATAEFLNNHKPVMDFVRNLNIDQNSEDFCWLNYMKKYLNNIYTNGIVYREKGDGYSYDYKEFELLKKEGR